MRLVVKRYAESCAIILFAITSFGAPASAITAELAKKCQIMAEKVYPMSIPGKKKGTAQAERNYFGACVKNNGVMPETEKQNTTAPAAK